MCSSDLDPALREKAQALAREALEIGRTGDAVGARQKLAEAVSTGAADALAYYNLAVADLRAGEFAPAEEHSWRAVELSVGNLKAIRLYVRVMERWGRAEAGVSNLERLAQRMTEADGPRLGIVEALLVAKHPADALQRASDLLRGDETNVEVMLAIARAYLAMERFEAAEYVLEQVLEIRKEARAYAMLGTIAWRRGDARKAMGAYQQAVKLDGGMADVHNNLAVLYQDAGDFDASAAEAMAAIQLDPGYAEAWLNLGNARRAQRAFGEAVIAYEEALKANPDCADCEFNRGVLELERKPIDQDEPTHYRRAIEHLQRYKAMRKGQMRGDPTADAYLDEARRMAEFLEGDGRKAKEAPPAGTPEAPAPDPSPGSPPGPAGLAPSDGPVGALATAGPQGRTGGRLPLIRGGV